MPRNFYWGKDAAIVAGSANFASLTATGFATYGLSSAQAATFGTLNTTLQAAYAAAVNPSTRTPVAVAAKDLAIRNMRAGAVLYGSIAYATSTVSDAQLVALGLLPRAAPAPRPMPTTPPTVEVVSVVGRTAKLRLRDAGSSRRGLPYGTKGANLFSYVGPAAPTDERAYHFEGLATRAVVEVIFPNAVVSGATVWVSACWVGPRGYTTVGSAPVSFTLQGGPVAAAA
jgi:hypothetical protein